MLKKFLGKEKGAITLFLLLAMLFFLIVLFSLFISTGNKSLSQTSEVDKIKDEYKKSVDNIDQIYNETLIENLSNILQLGDYVNYTYDEKTEGYDLLAKYSGYTTDQTVNQKSEMKWRILNIHEDGTVDLIGDISSSDQTIYFQGALGYNNGVYVLNDICKELYSNNDLGITARSVNLEDIENQMSEEGITARNTYIQSSTGTQYGNTNTYTGIYTNYPSLYAQENGSGINLSGTTEEERKEQTKQNGIGINQNGYTKPTDETSDQASNSLTVTQTYYSFSNIPANYFKDYDGSNSMTRDTLFNTETNYWLASRYAICNSPYASFGLCCINNFDISGNRMFYSEGKSNHGAIRLRPVVSLNLSQILPCTSDVADGIDTSIQHMHQIRE